MVRHTHDEPSPGLLCFTFTTEMSFYFNLFILCGLLVLFAHSSTNIDPLKVLSTMAPKQDRVYARG